MWFLAGKPRSGRLSIFRSSLRPAGASYERLLFYRSRQKERTLIAAADASARRFCLAVRACTRPALAISPGTERATEPAASQALRRIATGAPGRTRTGDLRFRKPPLYPTELPGRESTKSGEGEGNWWR